MKSKISRLVTVALLLLPTSIWAASIDMQEGLWEVTITMEMPGMPYAMPPTTHTQCITKEDQKDTKNVIPRGSEDCEVLDYNVSGNRVSWKVRCQQGTGTGEMTYRTNSYEGTMKMTSVEGGEQQSATMRFKGRRIGDCP